MPDAIEKFGGMESLATDLEIPHLLCSQKRPPDGFPEII